uniref:Uncharacterized protein n=1 Tax=Cyanothece sp. (strain PCC 7425 / ATCC 29141) TaxID=395961 RepID=B8HML4_CYAP4
MGTWDFLLQQEGDQSWLTLDSPALEILEGRYRVMADCGVADTLVEIQISYLFEENGLPKRRYQRRSHQTNDCGQVELLPPTYLHPGLWKLTCRLAEPPAHGPEQSHIQLQVLATSADLLADLDLLAPEPSASLPNADPHSPAKLPPAAIDAPPSSDISISEDLIHSLNNLLQVPTLPADLLILDQSSYTAQAGESITISGLAYAEGTVSFQFRNPRTQELVWEQSLLLPEQTLPLRFSCTCKLPMDQGVWLGEAKLILPAAIHSHLRKAQTFMVTVIPVESEPQPTPAATIAPVIPPPAETVDRVKLPELPVLNPHPLPLELRVCQGPSLPPQLYPNRPRPRRQAPQLPIMPQGKTAVLSRRTSSPSGYAQAVQTLQLGKRFWLTLSALAHRDVELVPQQHQTAECSNLPTHPSPSEAETDSKDLAPSQTAQPLLELLDLRLLHPLPTPEIIVPDMLLVAGLPLTIDLRLPDSCASICVKFWVEEPSTSSKVIAPRWLVDFAYVPQTGMLEASTVITLPAGLETVKFVAIAVDVETRQEGTQISVERTVWSDRGGGWQQ